jgi:DNA-binding NarL/FixJ family response regulator
MSTADNQHSGADSATSTALARSPNGAAGARPIAVALGRFDALVGRGLMQVLREDRAIRVIAADLDDAGLERAVAKRKLTVAMLDESSIARSAILVRLRETRPELGIIVLAHRPTVAYGARLFAGGANCLAKDVSAADVLAAVRIAAEGRRVFADVDGHLVERRYPGDVDLTPREVEVLEYLSRGRSHPEIAHAMRLSVETVRTHSAHIRRKLGTRSNRELIGLPVPNGLRTGLL